MLHCRGLWRVSIHAFRGEGDFTCPEAPIGIVVFQSTPSGGKATMCHKVSIPRPRVSIHAFRGEGDGQFYYPGSNRVVVSIHAFRGEGDRPGVGRAGRPPCFNPRLPGGRRLPFELVMISGQEFQSTPSGGKATRSEQTARPVWRVSIHAFRGEGDTCRRR